MLFDISTLISDDSVAKNETPPPIILKGIMHVLKMYIHNMLM